MVRMVRRKQIYSGGHKVGIYILVGKEYVRNAQEADEALARLTRKAGDELARARCIDYAHGGCLDPYLVLLQQRAVSESFIASMSRGMRPACSRRVDSFLDVKVFSD